MLWDGIARRAFGLGGGGGEGAGPVPAPETRTRPRLGLALGAGAARGWSHIGILRALEQGGIVPDVITGCSVGAVVGGCYAAGKLDEVEAFARSLSKRRVMGLLDFHISGSGLTRGPLVDAMRASYALPGVFGPVRVGGRWLMDGALVNPVPITGARTLGADIVVCVNLSGDVRLRGTVIHAHPAEEEAVNEALLDEPRRWGLLPLRPGKRSDAPGIATVMVDAFNITQDRIARSRLAGDPPDVMICPKLAPIGLFEFHRADEAIELGRQAAERALPDIRELIQETSRVA